MRRTMSFLLILTQLVALTLLSFIAPALAQMSPFPYITTANMQTAATATGNGASLNVSQASVAVLTTSGTFVGTVTYEATVDNSNWKTLTCYTIGSTTGVTTATAGAAVRCNVAGWAAVRGRISAYTSGSITVSGQSTSVPMPFAATTN